MLRVLGLRVLGRGWSLPGCMLLNSLCLSFPCCAVPCRLAGWPTSRCSASSWWEASGTSHPPGLATPSPYTTTWPPAHPTHNPLTVLTVLTRTAWPWTKHALSLPDPTHPIPTQTSCARPKPTLSHSTPNHPKPDIMCPTHPMPPIRNCPHPSCPHRHPATPPTPYRGPPKARWLPVILPALLQLMHVPQAELRQAVAGLAGELGARALMYPGPTPSPAPAPAPGTPPQPAPAHMPPALLLEWCVRALAPSARDVAGQPLTTDTKVGRPGFSAPPLLHTFSCPPPTQFRAPSLPPPQEATLLALHACLSALPLPLLLRYGTPTLVACQQMLEADTTPPSLLPPLLSLVAVALGAPAPTPASASPAAAAAAAPAPGADPAKAVVPCRSARGAVCVCGGGSGLGPMPWQWSFLFVWEGGRVRPNAMAMHLICFSFLFSCQAFYSIPLPFLTWPAPVHISASA